MEYTVLAGLAACLWHVQTWTHMHARLHRQGLLTHHMYVYTHQAAGQMKLNLQLAIANSQQREDGCLHMFSTVEHVRTSTHLQYCT